MSSQNIPPPPQYPHFANADLNESNVSKEGSIMENSVIYISDNGSPNYKSSLYNTPNQILPNLVNSINSTYQNLPPKSPKSNYRNLINTNIINNNNNNNYSENNNFINNIQKNQIQWRQQQQQQHQSIMENVIPLSSEFNPIGRFYSKPLPAQYWMMKPKDDWEDRQSEQQSIAATATPPVTAGKTRSHPNLMNDYVNLSGAESILNEILFSNRSNRPLPPPSFNQSMGVLKQPGMPMIDQFSSPMGGMGAIGGPAGQPSSPAEMVRNGGLNNCYTSHGLPDHLADPDTFSAESSRLVNLLLEENKRLRSKLRQSDSRLEAVDQLERKIHNLEMLFEELLTSQRRQRLLDLQLQQASLTNYLAKNVSQNDVGVATCCTSSSIETPRPNDSRKTINSTNQTMIPSSPVTTNKLTSDSLTDNSVIVCSKQQKTEMAKVYFEQRPFNDQDRYLLENDSSESWMEQIQNVPLIDDLNNDQNAKSIDDDFSIKLKHTIKSVNIATSPQFNRGSDNQSSSLLNSPSELLGRKIIMSTNPCVSRNWLVHHSSASPSYRVRLSQQPSFLNVNNNINNNTNNNRIMNNINNSTSKPTSAMNLSSS